MGKADSHETCPRAGRRGGDGPAARAYLAALAALLQVGAACGSVGGPLPPPGGDEELRIPLSDLGAAGYLGFEGGLYPGGNAPPARHEAEGTARARAIRPLDGDGRPDPAGAYVLLSVGMSNTTQEFCGGGPSNDCKPWTFMGLAERDPEVRRSGLVLVDGAKGGEAADAWDSLDETNYDRIREQLLAPRGLSELQVRIVWLKQAHRRPAVSLPHESADAHLLVSRLADIVRALHGRYPNLEQVFVSSRIYAGYATTALNPEPYAYESGFAVKWLVEGQIRQEEEGLVDPRAGDLAYERTPWIAWGPYLWAAGATPRADGLAWMREDFQADGTHPSPRGQEKVGRLLLEFFKDSPHARCWFVEGQAC